MSFFINFILVESSEKIKKTCTPRGDRTLDLWIRSPSRYPLRYRGCIYDNI